MNNLQAIQAIRKERQQYEKDEDVIHNRMIHKQIIQMWKQEYPQEVQRLEQRKLLDDLAFVVQQRMWQTMQEYQDGGMNPTDAREQAELQHYPLTNLQN